MKHYPGVVTAIVKSLNDPDGQGRIELQFPWLSDSLRSSWAPVAAPLAGKQRGVFFMPEIDDEVLVAFEHGSFDHPYIVGYLWNGVDMPPETDSQESRDQDAGRAHLAVRRRQRKKNRSQVQLRADDHPRRYGKLDHARGRRTDSEDEQRRRADIVRGQTKCRRS